MHYRPDNPASQVALSATSADGQRARENNADSFAARRPELIARAPAPAGGLP